MIRYIKISTLIILSCILSFYGTSQTPSPPIASHTGGFYADSLFLSLSSLNTGDTIFYTLDGSEPDNNSNIYSQPLLIKSRAGDTNVLSLIPTNFVQSGNWAFAAPLQEVFKATVVKARCISGNNVSEIITETFFVDTGILGRYALPVISLSTSQENLFSDSTGIYVPGITYTGSNNSGNYFETGVNWERPLFFEYFTENGVKVYQQNARVRIHGGDTRLLPQKALRLYADSFFSYNFFEDKNISDFKTLMLRNSGNDNISTMFRDVFMSELARDMGSKLEYQAGKPVIVFINGEFWGIHNLRERIDKFFIASNANVDPNNIDYLEKHGIVKEGDNLHYFLWYNYLENADMLLQDSYDYMSGMIDINNFINYNIAQLYFANIDWPSNNRDYWRPHTTGGKWRWIVFDTDFGFGLESYNHYDNNTLVFATTPNGPTAPPSWNTNYPYATMQLRKMLQNEKFRTDFVNRFADMLNTTFSADNVMCKINQFESIYSQAMPEHIQRWSKPQSYIEWQSNIEHMRDFALNRPAYICKYILEYFNEVENLAQDISDTSHITVNTPDTLMGHVILSTIRPTQYPFSGIYFHEVPVLLKAIPKTGYKFKMWAETGQTNPEILINLLSDTTFTALFETDTTYTPRLLFINEFMASNTSFIQDEYGEYDDWLEIYNPNPYTLDISGFYITDNFSQPQKHQFISGSDILKISPYSYLLLWADGTTAQGALHLNFKLSETGEVIALYDSTLTLIDSLIFGNQINDISFGRYPDGYNNWHPFNTPTPGSCNVISQVLNPSFPETNIIFPNPAHDIIFFKHEVREAEIFNTMGQIIISLQNISSLNISFLPKGLYYIRTEKSQIFKLLVY